MYLFPLQMRNMYYELTNNRINEHNHEILAIVYHCTEKYGMRTEYIVKYKSCSIEQWIVLLKMLQGTISGWCFQMNWVEWKKKWQLSSIFSLLKCDLSISSSLCKLEGLVVVASNMHVVQVTHGKYSSFNFWF